MPLVPGPPDSLSSNTSNEQQKHKPFSKLNIRVLLLLAQYTPKIITRKITPTKPQTRTSSTFPAFNCIFSPNVNVLQA